MLDYLGSLPMWLQIIIIMVALVLVLGLIGVIIYKLATAEKIKAGPGGIEIEDESDRQPEPDEPVNKKRTKK